MKKIDRIKINYILVEAEEEDVIRVHAHDHYNCKTPDKSTNDEKIAKYYFWNKKCVTIQKPFSNKNFPKLKRHLRKTADELKKMKNGHPDLFVYSRKNRKNRFFVESKSEGFHLRTNQLLFARESIKRNINYVVFKVINKVK